MHYAITNGFIYEYTCTVYARINMPQFGSLLSLFPPT